MSNSFIVSLLSFLFLQTMICQKIEIGNDTLRFNTYNINKLAKHELLLTKESIGVRIIPETGLGGSDLVWYNTLPKSDTISFNRNVKSDALGTQGIQINDSFIKPHPFEGLNKVILIIKSEKELLLLEKDRPYFKTSYIDSLIDKEQTVYAMAGKIMRAPADFNSFSEVTHLLAKPKRAKVNVLDGKQGYEKYGVMGIKGVVEMTKKEKCKKKRK